MNMKIGETAFITTRFSTPLGGMIACAGPDGICLLDYDDSSTLAWDFTHLREIYGAIFSEGRNSLLDRLGTELSEYFEGTRKAFTVPLSLHGTDFQLKAWNAMRKIPYGKTISYAEEASMIGNPKASRAVGGANGSNRLPILVPCHRVIATGGGLGGYSGGLDRKRFLLALEAKHS